MRALVRTCVLTLCVLVGLTWSVQGRQGGPASAQIQAALRALGLTGIGYSPSDCAGWNGTMFIPTNCMSGSQDAPVGATYITQTANSILTAEQAIGALSSGIMRVATTTGVITSLTNSAGIAANLSDETGTGVLVFATSPTLVTPVLGVATATTLGIGVAAPERSNLFEVKESGAAALTAGCCAMLSAVAKDSNTYYLFSLLNATYTTNIDNGFTGYIADTGQVRIAAPVEISWTVPLSLFIGDIQVTGDITNGAVNINVTPGLIGGFERLDSSKLTTTAGTLTTWGLLDITGATGGSASNQYRSIYVSKAFGNNGAAGIATKGTALTFAGDFSIDGSGDATNEFAHMFGGVNMRIGTGYTQTTGPTGNLWGQDLGVHGPIALQTGLLSGIVQVVNNFYNGSPSLGPSVGIAAITKQAVGAGSDSIHNAANTYSVDIGVYAGGASTSGPSGIGFTHAFQAGGAVGAWQVTTSKVGTAFYGRDIVTAGLDLAAVDAGDLVLNLAADNADDATDTWVLKVLATGNAMTWTNNSTLQMTLTTAGVLSPVTVQPTTAYKSVDGSTGATGSACTSFKNGLCVVATAPALAQTSIASVSVR